jgi:hypothetical protein
MFRHSVDLSTPYMMEIRASKLFYVEPCADSVPSLCSLDSQKKTHVKVDNYATKQELLSTHSTIRDLLARFYATEEYKEMADLNKGNKVVAEKRLYSQFFDLIEMIFQLYNIKFQVQTEEVQDSATIISPIVNEEFLKRYIIILLPEIVRLPPTIFKKFGITVFTFCQHIELVKGEYREIYNKRLANGVFPIEECDSPDKIRNHLYKIICYHMNHRDDDFTKDWKSLNVKGFTYHKNRPFNKRLAGFLHQDCAKSIMDDQAAILEILLSDNLLPLKKSDEIVKKKAKIIMSILLEIDSNFRLIAGWANS